MGDKQADTPTLVSNYRTRYSSGIRPKKRQSYGDFIEHPIAKRRISHAGVAKKIENKEISPAEQDLKKEYVNCYVLVEKLSDELSKTNAPVSDTLPTIVQPKEVQKKTKVKKCYFPGCSNTMQEQFFGVPSDTELRAKWIKQLKKKFVPGMVVCIKHFDESDVIMLPNQPNPTLREGAIPKKSNFEVNTKKLSDSMTGVIKELLSRSFINEEGQKHLDPFKDLTRKEIQQCGEGTQSQEVRSLPAAARTLSEQASDHPRNAVGPSTTDEKPAVNLGFIDYKKALQTLYPNIKDLDAIKSSCDLADILIDAKLILEGVKTLVEESADFSLSSLGSYLNDSELKQKVDKFSKIIFLNSPQTYNKLKTPLHLPNVSYLFPSLAPSGGEVHLESLTLGQLLNEASRLNTMAEESIRSLVPFGGCQLCPYSTGTVSMYKHVISSVFFNAPTFFKFLAEYLPLPSILFAKSPLTKECDSTADQTEPQIMACKDDNKVPESPTSSSTKQDSCVNSEASTKTSNSVSNAPVSSERILKDEFMRCICPKTGRNVAKLDVDTGNFLPKDLTVKVVGHVLTITGCKEDNGQIIEFLKTIELPNYVDADLAGCYYFKGKMSIHAPVLDNSEIDEPPSSSATATNSECSSTFVKVGSKQISNEHSKDDDISSPKLSKKKALSKSVTQFPKSPVTSNDDDIPRNIAVLMNVNNQEYVSLIAEVSKLFKPCEIIVKVKENKTISVRGETKSSDPHSKSRLYAVIEREFDLPKKIERTSLKAGCSGDGLLKIFAKVASDQNGH